MIDTDIVRRLVVLYVLSAAEFNPVSAVHGTSAHSRWSHSHSGDQTELKR